MRVRAWTIVVAVAGSVLLAGCTARKAAEGGGAYHEEEGAGGAYGEAMQAEESPAPAGGAYISSPYGAGTSVGNFARQQEAKSPPVERILEGLRYGASSATHAPGPGTEQYPDSAPNPIQSVAEEPVSTFSIDVDTASYANVRRFLEAGTLPPAEAVRIEELINYFDYDYPLPKTKDRPFQPTVAVVPSPWNDGRSLLHIGLQGYDVRTTRRPPLNLVLLVDVSGSMEPEDRLPLVQKALRVLVRELDARDRVAIAVYANAAGEILPPTPGDQHAKIEDAIGRLSAGGSTAGGHGIQLAYALAEKSLRRGSVSRVILATDGDFNVGISDPNALEALIAKKRESGIYLSVLGVGRGNYQDRTMQKLAQAGNGNASYIDTLSEARKVLRDEMRASLLPIADDVKIQVEFNPGRVAEYRLVGYETRMLRRQDFSNDRIDAGEIGAGANVTAIYELIPAGGRTTLDPLRYARETAPPAPRDAHPDELAFLRIRYKPPGAKKSILIERPITDRDSYRTLAAAPEATRFATAVAGYGQLLRGEQATHPSFGWKSVIDLANGARGDDEYGWRAEFVGLARDAEMLSGKR